MDSTSPRKWLLLIHQIPPKPNALRVKIWRRLQQIGAVAIKQSVYAMPLSEHSWEDLSWTLKEIIAGGGEGSISEARFVEGLTDHQIIALFQNARKTDYEKIIQEAGILMAEWSAREPGRESSAAKSPALLSRLQARLDDTRAIDFFEAPERATADILLKELTNLGADRNPANLTQGDMLKDLTQRTWVTRGNIFVDRLACAWLIQRFIDPEAEFKFVSDPQYIPQKGELRFDMFEGEFTHQSDKCSFEVMIDQMQIQDKALVSMAELVHDIDLKDNKFSRKETEGFKAVLTGLVAAQPDDDQRILEGFSLFENLYAYFHRHRH